MTNREHPDQTASVEARLSWQDLMFVMLENVINENFPIFESKNRVCFRSR